MLKGRYSVKMLLALVFLAAVFFSFVLSKSKRLKQIEQARSRLPDSLIVGKLRDVTPPTLDRIAGYVFGVEAMTTENFLRINNESDLGVLAKLSDLPHVVEVRITECQLGNLRHFAPNSTVRSLTITDCFLVNLDGVGLSSGLEHLKLDTKLESLEGLSNASKLQRLEISHELPDGIQGVEEVASLANLTSLNVVTNSKSTAEIFEYACQLGSLRHLKMWQCEDVDDLKRISNLKSLESVFLREFDGELEWFSKLENLESLIALNSYFSSPDLQSLESLHKLRCLELRSPGKTLRTLSGLEELQSLESVRIFPAKGLEDISAIQSLSKLRMLDLSGISTSKIDGKLKLASLETLSLRCCSNLQSLAFLEFAPNLKEVELRYCSNLSDASSLGNCTNMEGLIIQQCPSLKLENQELKNVATKPAREYDESSALFYSQFDKAFDSTRGL